jgi:hypothetical protein
MSYLDAKYSDDVHNTQGYWFFALSPSSCVPKYAKKFQKLDLFLSSDVEC